MHVDLVKLLRKKYDKAPMVMEAADTIMELNKRIDFLMSCIYEAEEALDRGADNDWARAALEKAVRGWDNGEA
jgi:hypothetical protein